MAALLALAVGDVKDAVVIGVVLVLNAVLGFVQERRAEAGIEGLRAMLSPRAIVRRDGRPHDVDAADVVPGDVLVIKAGDRIGADGRLLLATALAVDESALTGESLPVDKHAEAVAGDEPGRGLVSMNTVVSRGRGEVLVTATGMETAMGQLAGLIQAAPQRPTPLQRQLAGLGRRLPAVVTVTLAVGTAQMAKRRTIVKRLSSVETLGSATIVQVAAVHVGVAQRIFDTVPLTGAQWGVAAAVASSVVAVEELRKQIARRARGRR